MASDLVDGSVSGMSAAEVGGMAYGQLASMIADTGTAVDLSNPSEDTQLIQGVAGAAGAVLSPGTVTGAAELVADVNQQIDQIPASSDQNYVAQVMQAQVVAQGTIAPQLDQVAASTDPTAIDTLVASQSGSALQAEISSALIGDVTPPALSINDVSQVDVDNGSTVYQFTVSPSGIAASGRERRIRHRSGLRNGGWGRLRAHQRNPDVGGRGHEPADDPGYG